MNVASDWWKTFFSGPAVESWLMATSKEQTQSEADFIQDALQVAPPARLLDLPCGGGRHSHSLAARGFNMTGVDLSVEYTWIRDGKIDKRSMSARIYGYRELFGLFAEAGFADVQAFGSFAREPFRLGSSRFLVVATKP